MIGPSSMLVCNIDHSKLNSPMYDTQWSETAVWKLQAELQSGTSWCEVSRLDSKLICNLTSLTVFLD